MSDQSNAGGLPLGQFKEKSNISKEMMPNFFRLAPQTPEVSNSLLDFAKFSYLKNPLPAIFKERLFVYLSRFCSVRYCIARHIGFLSGLGAPAGELTFKPQSIDQIIRLLRRPLPGGDQLQHFLSLLESYNIADDSLDDPETLLEEAIFACATHIFLQTPHQTECWRALQRSFGEPLFQQLLVFLTFVRTAHFWTQVHPELKLEDDIDQLLKDQEALAECIHYDPDALALEADPFLLDERVSLQLERADAELLRVTLSSIGDGVITTDLSGHITNMNGIAEHYTGWTLGDAVGKPITQIFSIVDELSGAVAENSALKALAAGTGIQPNNHTVLIAKDGTHRFIDDNASPIRSSDGKMIGSVLVFKDITERRNLEKQLAKQFDSARFLVSLVESSSEAIISKSLTGIIRTWNAGAEQLFGYTADYAVGRHISLIIPPERLDEEPKILAAIQAGKRIEEFQTVRMRRDMQLIQVSLTVSPIQDEAGNVIGVSKIVRDITDRIRAEEELRRAHTKLQQVLDSITDGLLILDNDWRFIYFNEQGAKLIGMHPDGLIGRCVWEVFPHAKDLLFYNAYHQAVETNQPVHFEEFYPEPINKWLNCHCYPSTEGLSVYFQDVTNSKRAELTLRQNAALFATLVEQAPMGVYVVDSQFRLQQVNAAALPVFSSIAPLIGRDFDEVMEIQWGPEVGRQCTAIFRHTLATGERYISPPFTEHRYDLGYDQTFEWQTQRVTLPDGQFGVVCYFHEITDRVRSQRALFDSEERTRLATDATGVGIWEWDIIAGQIRWDAQMFRIYGVEPTSNGLVPYSMWQDAVFPEDLPEQEAILRDTVERQGQSNREFRIRRLDNGQCRYVQSVETIRTDMNGKPKWIVGTNLDVTQRRETEERLRRLAAELHEADRRKDEFLATLAHELRNPLAPLRNGLQLLRMVGSGDETSEMALEMMERQLCQMVRLVDDLMDVSRISTGKVAIKKTTVELSSVIRSAVETSRPLIDQMRHELTVTLPSHLIMIEADLTRLSQVFSNLLNNAAKYNESGGQIWLTVQQLAHQVQIAIRDSGIGIASDQLPRIFDLFSQVDHSLEKSQGGLGIGLSLVKRLVELHGGTVEVRSEGFGCGSEFIVTLPISRIPQHEESRLNKDKIAKRVSLRILVVDDNRDSAESLVMMLKMKGHVTHAAYDGEAALGAADEFQPEVILLDIGLPKLNGYKVCEILRARPRGRDIVIIAQTGWGQTEDRQRTRDAGFDHHLVKPIDPSGLIALLETIDTGG